MYETYYVVWVSPRQRRKSDKLFNERRKIFTTEFTLNISQVQRFRKRMFQENSSMLTDDLDFFPKVLKGNGPSLIEIRILPDNNRTDTISTRPRDGLNPIGIQV